MKDKVVPSTQKVVKELTRAQKTFKGAVIVLVVFLVGLLVAAAVAAYVNWSLAPKIRASIMPRRTEYQALSQNLCDSNHTELNHPTACNPTCTHLWQSCLLTSDIKHVPAGAACVVGCGLCDYSLPKNRVCIGGNLVQPCFKALPVGGASFYVIQSAVDGFALTANPTAKTVTLSAAKMNVAAQEWTIGSSQQKLCKNTMSSGEVPCPCAIQSSECTVLMDAGTFAAHGGKTANTSAIQWEGVPPAISGQLDPFVNCRANPDLALKKRAQTYGKKLARNPGVPLVQVDTMAVIPGSLCAPCMQQWATLSMATKPDLTIQSAPNKTTDTTVSLTTKPESYWDRPDLQTPAHIQIMVVDPSYPTRGFVIVDSAPDRMEASRTRQLMNSNGTLMWEPVPGDGTPSVGDDKYIWYFLPVKMPPSTVSQMCDATQAVPEDQRLPGVMASPFANPKSACTGCGTSCSSK